MENLPLDSISLPSRVFYSPSEDAIYVGKPGNYKKTEETGFIQRTGTSIAFDKWATYDDYSNPSSGNYSYSLTSAVIGMVQVSYHEDTVVPTFSQVGIDVIIVGEYQPNIVNKIMFELIGATRVLINILPL